MLARPATAFDSPDFLYEIKWDGTRCILFAEEKSIRLQNRKLIDVSFKYPEIAAQRDRIKAQTAILDGEIVYLREGKPDFYMLQKRFALRNPKTIRNYSARYPTTFVAFDLLYLNGESCLKMPLCRRKELLETVVEKSPSIIVSHPFTKGTQLFREACRLELEGIVAKRADSPYSMGSRSQNWLKIKALKNLDCLIAGYVPRDGVFGESIGSLVLAEKRGEAGHLFYRGHVASGLSDRQMSTIYSKLQGLKTDRPTLNLRRLRGVQWVEPRLKCRVVFNEYTWWGHLRAPVFKKLIE